MIEKNKNIIIYGGTFDPPHLGHLFLAEAAREKQGAEQVVFLPAGDPPHKQNKKISDSSHRYNMVYLATKDNPYFKVSDFEIKQSGLSFTAKTLSYFKEKGFKVSFIIGADSLDEIFSWKNPEYILKNSELLVLPRKEYNIEKILIENKYKNYLDNINKLNTGRIDFSSSQIRNRVRNNQRIKYMTPFEVEEYIVRNRLYLSSNSKIIDINLVEQIKHYLKNNLSDYRYKHTLRVVETASKINPDQSQLQKVKIAALCHDLCKGYSNLKLQELVKKSNWPLKTFEYSKESLLHGPASAYLTEIKFDIRDSQILEAIRYHTIGHPDLSLIGKIVFLADKIEPGRDYPGRDAIYSLSLKNIDQAILKLTDHNLQYLTDRNIEIHPNLILLRNKILGGKNNNE
ncbi:MAG: nicotinate-nucleotide adenylyltransferase [Halarsenatibacteraceae bacterium]